jgi:pyruvate dehydrogenase E1 component alpha subunit
MPQSLPDDLSWRLMETMLTIRRFEEAVLRLSTEGAFRGHYHLYIGQEATGAAVMTVLETRDRITTTHRNHGHVLARGADPGRAMAEILGRASGLNGGRGGTLHLTDPALGFLSTSGIVGGCISLGVGAGYACKRKRDGSIAVAFFGDGALEEGVSFEALNIASLWKLPIILLCENNSGGSWAPGEGYPTLVHASTDLRSIAQSLRIKAVRVDGADAAAVHGAASEAAAQCRRGEGPVFMEAMTRRWPGSNPLWPQAVTGVTDIRMATGELAIAGEHRDWLEHHDPVLRLARQLMATGAAAKTRLHELDAATRARIENAVAFAREAPLPDAQSAFEHVFA